MRSIAFACLVLLAAISVAPLAGQNVSATLNGTVRDSQGAVIAAAAVTLTNEANGATRSGLTNTEGYFVFPDLLVGSYSLKVEMSGFKTYQQREIRLTAGEIRALGQIGLALGEVAEVVTVEANATPVELGSGEKSGVITGEEIDSLAIRGRDFLDVLRLLPGVVDESEGREAPGPDGIRGIFINGARENQKNMTVDGVTSMDTGSNSTTHTAPTIDMIREVKVLTSNYQAEFGRAVGGTIIVTTKGGGTQYHASATWSHRHESFNANNYFNNLRGVRRPPYRFNIASWEFAGPVWPKNRRDAKVFFYFTEEFSQQKVNYDSRTVRMPNLLERQGDFTQTFDLNGARLPVYDPWTGAPFPGNIIPNDRQHPIGTAILNMFPAPNFVDPVASRVNQWNYITSVSGAYPRRQETIRIDFNPSQRWQTYLRYTQNADEQHPTYGVWVNGPVNYDLTPLTFKQPGRGFTMNIARTIGATLMNQLILGYSMNRLTYFPDNPDKISKKALGINLPQWRPELNLPDYIPNMSFGVPGTAVNPSLNNGIPYKNVNHIFSVTENLSKIYRTHTIRTGLYFERTRKDQVSSTPTRGTISFSDDSNNPFRTRYGFASTLLGIMTSYQEGTGRPYGLYRFSNVEWYIQDNWRVNRRLALDYGIRFYHNLPQADVRGQTSAFVPGLWDISRAPRLITSGRNGAGARVGIDPVTGQIYNPGFVGTFVPGSGDPALGMVSGGTNGFPKSLYTVPGLSLGPRSGFAYDLLGDGRTALRGGAGIFYDRIQGNPTMNMINNPPATFTPTLYYTTFDELAASANSGLLAPSNIGHSLYGRGKMPTVYNYSLGIQRALGRRGGTVIDVSYVGNVARHLLWLRNINPVPIGAQFPNLHPENRDPTTNAAYANNFLRPFRGYGDILEYEFGGTSSYNSLQTTFRTRMKAGLQLRASYTFAKTLGTSASDTSPVSPFFKPREWNYGRLSYDRDHVYTMNYSWAAPRGWMPQNKWLRAPIERWELNGTTQFSGGQPFRPGISTVDGQNFTGTPSEGARVAWISGTTFARPGLPRATGAIETPYFGNAGVGILRRPGINNFDVRITRRFPIGGEKRWIEFRGEMFNMFNHTQFSGLDETARFDRDGSQINALFLEPTSARRPRQVNFALKLYW
ncbi:MAG: carboxypeptidase regulatory-like domain-containing protein [Bryobacteraceae bacterium]